MDAGLKMDKLVAEHVMGEGPEHARPYSTDIAVAWAIVDRITDRGFRLQLEGARIWNARFYKSVAHTLETRAQGATGSTAAEAICIAALAMNGITG